MPLYITVDNVASPDKYKFFQNMTNILEMEDTRSQLACLQVIKNSIKNDGVKCGYIMGMQVITSEPRLVFTIQTQLTAPFKINYCSVFFKYKWGKVTNL